MAATSAVLTIEGFIFNTMYKARPVLLADPSDNYSTLYFSIPQNNQMQQGKKSEHVISIDYIKLNGFNTIDQVQRLRHQVVYAL